MIILDILVTLVLLSKALSELASSALPLVVSVPRRIQRYENLLEQSQKFPSFERVSRGVDFVWGCLFVYASLRLWLR